MVGDSASSSLHRLAIEAALNCRWEEAIEVNRQIIKLNPENIECLNRLAKAYFELGKINLAKKNYQLSLRLDPYNSIAQKNLKKIASFKKDIPKIINGHSLLSPALFVEEPGITKLITLIKVAEPQKLLSLSAGMSVTLIPKSRGICVTDLNSQYLGALPDDTAHHLRKLIGGGNKYAAIIKSVKPNSLTILVRETFRSKKFKNQASFLDESKVVTFSSDHINLLNQEKEDFSDIQSEAEDLTG